MSAPVDIPQTQKLPIETTIKYWKDDYNVVIAASQGKKWLHYTINILDAGSRYPNLSVMEATFKCARKLFKDDFNDTPKGAICQRQLEM